MNIDNINIDSLNNIESLNLLKKLKLYRDLRKKVGKRSKNIFQKLINNDIHTFEVEYSLNLEENYVLEKALEVYKKVFKIEVKKDNIKLIPKQNLIGGMKVYFDDKMVDMSFLKIFNKLKNI